MKRKKPEWGGGVRWGEVLQNFTDEQLAAIGAIMMAYNEVEEIVHRIAGSSFEFPGDYYQITSRIHGLDGLKAIINLAVDRLNLDKEPNSQFEGTLSDFMELKSLRDSISHARIKDAKSGVAVSPRSKGGRTEVLLSSEALERVFERLVLIKHELDELHTIFVCARRLQKQPKPKPPHEAKLQKSIRDSTLKCKEFRARRKSLKALPVFPNQPEVFELPTHRFEN